MVDNGEKYQYNNMFNIGYSKDKVDSIGEK
jgi:hypothetical protein